MRNKSLTWTGVVVLVVGIALLFLRATAINIVVMVLGGMFLLAAAINLYLIFSDAAKVKVDSGGRARAGSELSVGSVLSAIAAAALGLWMLLDPSALSTLMVYLIAGLMIVAGLYHACLLAFGFRPMRFPFIYYVLPILLVVAGVVVLLVGALTIKNYIVLIAGVAMIVYAVSCFLEVAGSSSYYRQKQITA